MEVYGQSGSTVSERSSPFCQSKATRELEMTETSLPLNVPWLETGPAQAYDSAEELYGNIRSYYVNHIDLQEDALYDVLTTWTFATYRQEELWFAPYLFFLGPVDSGKTRCLECLHQLSYRAIMATSTSCAALFRAIKAWHPTPLLDEAQIYSSKDRAEILAILNNGYRRGQKVLRVESVGKSGKLELNTFDVFGCKAIAGTEEMLQSLMTRCIIFQMSKATRKVRFFLDTDEAKTLRSQLSYYRDHSKGDMPFEYGEYGRLDGLEALGNSRLGELFYPLIWVAPSDEIADRLLSYARKVAGVLVDEEQASSEGLTVKALCDTLNQVEAGKLPIQRIVDRLNEGLEDRDKWRSNSVGRVLSRLGFRKTRLTGGRRAIAVDQALIQRLKMRYMPNEASQVSSEKPSLSSLSSLQMRESHVQSDKSDRSDDVSGVYPNGDLDERGAVVSALEGRTWRFLVTLEDYLTRVLNSRDKASAWIKRLREESILAEDPEGLWRLIRQAGAISLERNEPVTEAVRRC